ncbi:iron complex outermembrane receptor protein [Sphingomonas kyeonggiensis]|uniref:Iron complex outermembrane receptor protein n=1 Tax=Sphingomonas kyeonggiensis TaxID=1268553 RepID=A0A7W7K4K3_9SPHN|nr:TonB-dependent receptor [Sphingomonas kyeonggiensis]MBB4840878.1 iron complex outermembrane receptor protein [Sphingomonas kyeonggiensis]
MTYRSEMLVRLLHGSTALCALIATGAIVTAPAHAQEAGASAAGANTTTAAPAALQAQDEAETAENNVVVTGSLFRRTNAETPSPVTVLSAQSLEQRGLNTVAEALQRVSAGNAGTITQGWNNGNNFAAGANAVSLRGLTVQATLSVFDGLRMAPYPLADDGQRNFVDLNTIPNAIVDRIEVLRDGASSTYGADAVAGVINVITKKEVKGLHLNASAGISQLGDAGERRFDATWGYGDLSEDGFNVYVSGEYLKQDTLWARDRGYPFNTNDWSRICNGSGGCMHNNNGNGVSPDGTYGLSVMPGLALVRPVTTAGATLGTGRFSFLNPALGCGRWTPVQLGAAQLDPAQGGSPDAPANGRVCEVNFTGAYGMLQPEVERYGFSTRFTANLGENHQLYVQGNYYRTDTLASQSPWNFRDRPTSPRSGALTYNVILPVYVCAAGVGTLNGVGTGCTAANGTLNPYNPYAAAGQTAQISFAPDRVTTDETSARSLRGVIGLSGSFGGWNYTADFTASSVQLDRTQNGYPIPQRLMDVIARGTFNFANPNATPQAVWDYIMPASVTRSNSDLWQVTATVSRSLFELPGGALQTAGGVAYRRESINAPSANPQNDAHPYDRYYGVNAVGTAGSRNVFSAFGEIQAPIVKQFEVNLSGRYDSYSTGQKNFSPKVGAKFTPIPQVALRGTWSKGFRIPSFNEAFGLPTTGFVSQGGGNFCTRFAAFCAAHNNNAYATQQFSVGLTSVGNPQLKPERSENLTLGAIFEPIRNVSLTVDFWRIKVRDQIIGPSDIDPIIQAYYSNNGVVNIPGYIVTAGNADQANPNALPHIGTVQSSYANANRQVVQGVDLGVNARFDISDGVRLTSSFEASYLDKNHLTLIDPATGEVADPEQFEGTLSPCNVTSCSGSPRWRASWQNTLEFGGTTVSATAYYTSGYDMGQVDFGATPGDCQSALDSGAAAYDDGTPVLCRSKAIWNLDLTASHKISDQFTIYANALNVLGIAAPFDPNAGYSAYGFNPAWAGPNILGRYFRLGVKLDF